jgi:hypothetical protein
LALANAMAAAAAAGWVRDELEVKSVDGYQGREKEVILLSTVRANGQQQVRLLLSSARLDCTHWSADPRHLLLKSVYLSLTAQQHGSW